MLVLFRNQLLGSWKKSFVGCYLQLLLNQIEIQFINCQQQFRLRWFIHILTFCIHINIIIYIAISSSTFMVICHQALPNQTHIHPWAPHSAFRNIIIPTIIISLNLPYSTQYHFNIYLYLIYYQSLHQSCPPSFPSISGPNSSFTGGNNRKLNVRLNIFCFSISVISRKITSLILHLKKSKMALRH